jgi:hypothetical protein
MYDEAAKGKENAELNANNFAARAQDLRIRLKNRLHELELENNIIPKPPVVLGGAWVVPRFMLDEALAATEAEAQTISFTVEGRKEIERIAMEVVMQIEREAGFNPVDISKENRGCDIESKDSNGHLRFIEVKGRAAGSKDVTVTRGEMYCAANSPSQAILAVVIVDGAQCHVIYFSQWFPSAPQKFVGSSSIILDDLRKSAIVSYEADRPVPAGGVDG